VVAHQTLREKIMIKFYATLMSFVSELDNRREQKGATAVEYGLLVALIAAVLILVVTTLGTDIQAQFQKVVDAI